MSRLLIGVRLVTCVSLILFTISCYNMMVRSEKASNNKQQTKSESIPEDLTKTKEPSGHTRPTEPGSTSHGTSALTVVPDYEDEEDATVTTEDENAPDFSNMDVFYPTKEWQELKPGQAIPKGLHVRLNMQTGQREAKLMEGDSGLKYWVKDGKQGIVNTDKDYFTPEDLKKALKEFKVNKIDDEDTERMEVVKQKYKSYEELKKDLESLEMNIKTDRETILELTGMLNSTSIDNTERIDIMENLLDYMHQIDNAILFCDIGGMKMVIKSLNDSDENVRSISASLLASSLQNNPKVKIYCIEAGLLQHFVRALSTEAEVSVKRKLLFALSAMVRNFPYAQTKFGNLGGFSVLAKLFSEQGPAEDVMKLTERALSLVVDLMEEHESVTKDNREHSSKEMLRQYDEFLLQDHLVQNGFCGIVCDLLDNIPPREFESTVEIILKAALKLKDSCLQHFKNHAGKIKFLRDNLIHLYHQDTELEFYKDWSEIANKLFHFLMMKDEL
ncbi:nucleotide exchange factor SIL1-like [Saccostrea cucullata]|uniref:nucleotide exchange factor SIL1-like n=1 Tax=Saccostrea cuccullata TaxID=36930 RepID=UPI002ED1A3B2